MHGVEMGHCWGLVGDRVYLKIRFSSRACFKFEIKKVEDERGFYSPFIGPEAPDCKRMAGWRNLLSPPTPVTSLTPQAKEKRYCRWRAAFFRDSGGVQP
jgi:hypothetical protein